MKDIDTREQPVLAKINSFTVENVLEAVLRHYTIKKVEQVTERRGAHAEARKIAMFLAGLHCRRNEALTSLAARFGDKISSFNMVTDRLKKVLPKHPPKREDIAKIEQIMRSICNNVEV